MILHDRVQLHMEKSFDPPQHDLSGNEVMDVTDMTVPAEVVALDTREVLSEDRVNVISRYRVILGPQLDIPQNIGDGLTLTWQGIAYGVDGAVERHMLRGRLHHYELISKRVT